VTGDETSRRVPNSFNYFSDINKYTKQENVINYRHMIRPINANTAITQEENFDEAFAFYESAANDIFDFDSFEIIDEQTMRFTAIVTKTDLTSKFGSDWTKRNFPFKCFYSEVEIPAKVFQFSSTEPCYPFGQCMLQTWDVGTTDPWDALNGVTANAKCASIRTGSTLYVEDEDLDLVSSATKGWVANSADP